MTVTKDPTGRYIDLHLHSTASDGVYAPAKVMDMAAARGLAAVALTDHDTVAGHDEARATAALIGIEFIAGIELAAEYSRGTMHILGYGVDPRNDKLTSLIDEIVAVREARNQAILDKLLAVGIRIDHDELKKRHPRAVIGRPHFAAALVRLGAASSFHDAFERFLGRTGVAYVERRNPPASQIIGVIRHAGGAAVLAHPSQLKCESRLELETVLHGLKSAGMAGIEVIHPDHRSDQTSDYLSCARQLDLAPTGGSDFHAFPADTTRIGFGRTRVPYAWLEALRVRMPA